MTKTKYLIRGFPLVFGYFCVGCFLFPEDSEVVEEYPLPTLESTVVRLVEYPSTAEFAAYYCPLSSDSFVVEATCEASFGPAPLKSDLTFYFEVEFRAGNSGDLPLPVLELLLDLEIFEEQEQQSLGSTCVEFCGESDPECGDVPGLGSCVDHEEDLDTREDLVARALELVFIGIASGGDWEEVEEAANQNIRIIPPGDELIFTVRFGVGIDALLEIFEVLAFDAIDDWMAGEEVEWVVPYRIGGRTWIDVPIVGRFGLDFGPMEGEWVL